MKPHIYFAVLLVVMLVACPPSPLTPSPDASDASPMVDGSVTDAGAQDAAQAPDAGPCGAACNRLTVLGCPEGNDTLACVVTCDRVAAAQLIPLRLDCMISAGTVDAMRACGVRCAQ